MTERQIKAAIKFFNREIKAYQRAIKMAEKELVKLLKKVNKNIPTR